MKSVFRSGVPIVFICAVVTLIDAQTQSVTADQVLDRYMAARGGEAKFLAVESLFEIGEIAGPIVPSGAGFHAPRLSNLRWDFEFYFKAPNLRLTINHAKEGKVWMRGCDGTEAWSFDPFYGLQSAGPKSGLSGACSQAFTLEPTIWREKKLKIELKGTRQLDGRQTYLLQVAWPGAPHRESYYFDADNYLLTRVISYHDQGLVWPTLKAETTFSDYREIHGLKFPFVIRTVTETSDSVLTLRGIQINVPISDSTFAQPKPPKSR